VGGYGVVLVDGGSYLEILVSGLMRFSGGEEFGYKGMAVENLDNTAAVI
jgi:hypothetical protein